MVTVRRRLEHLVAEKYEAQMFNFENSTPLRRRIDPEDVASAVCWLIEGAGTVIGPGAGGRFRPLAGNNLQTC